MPAIDRLCALLKVRNRGGDSLDAADFRSPATYRAALHAALIRRSPGKYSRRWQAARLGLSKHTVRRYDRQRGVCAVPMYQSWRVHWGNVDEILPNETLMGQFLESDDGSRYPAWTMIARKLLAKGKALLFRWQEPNFYQIPGSRPVADALEKPDPAGIPARTPTRTMPPREAREAAATARHEDNAPSAPPSRQADPPEDQQNGSLGGGDVAGHSDQGSTLPLPSDRAGVTSLEEMTWEEPVRDSFVTYLYETLREIDPEHALTRKNARKIVEEYGETHIRRALKIMSKRRNIRRPAGFLRVFLRSEKTGGYHPSLGWQRAGK